MYREALQEVLNIAKREKVVTSLADITHIAVRIVAPGSYFQTHRKIDEKFIGKLLRCESILPLHIPPVLEEITSVNKLLPKATLVGASDSAFHATIPSTHTKYSLRDAENLEVRRYGYHGLSVGSIVCKLPEVLGSVPARTVVAHIGSGVSITALKDGQSIYNSMGYTPASGVMMGSRAGDMDPGALIEVLNRTETKLSGGHRYIQSNGGFAGLLGVSDLRTVLNREQHGDVAAKEAMEIFIFNIQSQIATAVTALRGVDALVLSATAMERNPDLRKKILSGLEFLGITLDEKCNDSFLNRSGVISLKNSVVRVALVPTDEMGEMARVATQGKAR
jgi:acetate kinase